MTADKEIDLILHSSLMESIDDWGYNRDCLTGKISDDSRHSRAEDIQHLITDSRNAMLKHKATEIKVGKYLPISYLVGFGRDVYTYSCCAHNQEFAQANYIKSIVANFGYRLGEIIYSRYDKISPKRACDAVDEIMRGINAFAWGSIFTNEYISRYTPKHKDWPNCTIEDIYEDILGMALLCADTPDTLILTEKAYHALSVQTCELSPGLGYITWLQALQKKFPYIKNIGSIDESDFPDSIKKNCQNIAILCKNSPKNLALVMLEPGFIQNGPVILSESGDCFTSGPIPIRSTPIQIEANRIGLTLEARTAGVCIYHPDTMIIADGV